MTQAKKEKAPWLTGESLFTYVKNNIDEEGYFASDTLPDRSADTPGSQIGMELGSEDGFASVFTNEEKEPLTKKIFDLTQNYSNDPTEANAFSLYYEVCASDCILYHETLLNKLAQDKISPALQNLAIEFLYHAPEREAVKFAILVCGLSLLNLDNPVQAKKLHEDLLLLSRCEEFTVHVIYACELNHELSQDDFWNIMTHTNGWGKIYAMESYNFDTQEKRDWLLAYGSDISVLFPTIALNIIKDGHLTEAAERPILSKELVIGMLRTITYYVILLFDTNGENEEEENDVLPVIDLADLLGKILKSAKKHCNRLELAYWLYRLTELLNVIAENQKWEILGANQCHLLLSEAEQLLFSKDWRLDIIENLIDRKGRINYMVIEFALDIGLDINKELLALLKEDPQRTELYSVLLQAKDKRIFNTALSLAKKNLASYMKDARCLSPILGALSNKPGVGREFIAAGLTSIFDVTRAAAINALEKWPAKNITPTLRLSLIKGKELCQNPYLTFRIDAILNNKKLDINSFLEDLVHEND
ncbi:MAG: hypothetical protein LKE29_09425 [Acidaminococcaceae bacterium]|nr:hypothetical protein [Acidaminococcaceae bacterium]